MNLVSVLRPARRHRQRGVNLIEVMVAMAIGLFLVLGATTLYVNSKKTADVDDSIARLQETARYALSIIESDLRMANYWGQTKNGSLIDNKNTQITCATPPCAGTAEAFGSSTATTYCGAAFATATEFFVDSTNNGYGLPLCTARTTAVTSADTLTVRRTRVAATGLDVAATKLQVCASRTYAKVIRGADPDCPTNSQFFDLVTNAYYVDQQSDQSATIPSLRRKALTTDGAQPDSDDVEIIPGIEDLQIEFGWDNSSEDSAGAVRYLQPGSALLTNGATTPGPNGRIVSVRVWLLVRAETPDASFTDTRTYGYADRTGAAVSTLNSVAAQTAQYRPNDNFRRLLVSRTFFIRNVMGT